MGKIGKRRKRKGRPPSSAKADLVRSSVRDSRSPKSESDLRRSTRRRNITYIGEFYDDFDDEDEFLVQEEEEERRRKDKNVKLVVKIPQSRGRRVNSVSRGGSVSVSASASAVSSDDDDGDDDDKPLKKRKLGNNNDGGDDEDLEDDDDEDEARSAGSGEAKKKRGRNGDSKRVDSVPGTPTDSQSGLPLPDSKELEFILDKLQKKDTYGVYGEPVDPEELPDYHDVIDHPMDFGTIRKKLANGDYTNLEQFENDVFLVSTNAMQYNAPETVYFKQARAIQELARKKFQRLRVDIERSAVELKPEQNVKSNCAVKKPIKKSPCKPIPEPLSSDFSSGATLATVKETCTLSNTTQTGGCERPGYVNTHIEGNGNSSLNENKPEKAEEQFSGKCFQSKLGRKPFVLDENRRATYNISNQPVVRVESMTSVFEGENKQLISVGLHVDHSYARSLARFAATLGPVAWKVASRRIEQALPVGYKFGRGWVGEYEPLPTPVLMLGDLTEKHPTIKFPAKPIIDNTTAEKLKVGERELRPNPMIMTESHNQKQQGKDFWTAEPRKDGRTAERLKVQDYKPHQNPKLITENHKQKLTGADSQTAKSRKDEHNAEELKASHDDMQLGLRTMNSSGVVAFSRSQGPAKERNLIGPTSQGNPGFFGVSGAKPVVNAMYQQQTQAMNSTRSEYNALKKPESNRSSSNSENPNDVALRKQPENPSGTRTSGLLEMVPRIKGFAQPVTVKQLETNGIPTGGLPNGKVVSSYSNNHQASNLPYNFVSNPQARAATFFSPGTHDQGLSDPVQMMRMLAEKTQSQQKPFVLSTSDSQITSSDPSSRRDDSSGAATAAARAWMTLGAAQFMSTETSGPSKMQFAAALYNPAREVPQTVPQYREEASVSGRQLQSEKSRFPPQVFLPQPAHIGNESQFQNNRPMVVPQMVMSDLSRFQLQSTWQGLAPHTQPNKKQDALPPDLNVSFQSSGSPVKQSSSILVDSQQPDLALQL